MASRINYNLRWVMRKCSLAGLPVIEEEILNAFNHVQLDIMERTSSVKETFNITLDGIATTFPSPAEMGRPFFISQPPNWSQPLQFTLDPSIFDYIKKGQTPGNQPTIVLLYNDQFVFNVPGTAGDVLTFYTSVFPTDAQDAAAMIEGGDPVLSKHWDTVLRLGAMDELMIGTPQYPQWHQAYVEAYNQEAHNHIQEGGVPMLIDHSSNRLGF